MKTVIRIQSLWLLRKSNRSHRLVRVRPISRIKVTARPMRKFGVKPQLEVVP